MTQKIPLIGKNWEYRRVLFLITTFEISRKLKRVRNRVGHEVDEGVNRNTPGIYNLTHRFVEGRGVIFYRGVTFYVSDYKDGRDDTVTVGTTGHKISLDPKYVKLSTLEQIHKMLHFCLDKFSDEYFYKSINEFSMGDTTSPIL